MFDVNSVSIYQLDYDFYRVIVDGNTRRIDRTRRTYDNSRVSVAFSDCLIFEVKDLFHCLLAMQSVFKFSNSDNQCIFLHADWKSFRKQNSSLGNFFLVSIVIISLPLLSLSSPLSWPSICYITHDIQVRRRRLDLPKNTAEIISPQMVFHEIYNYPRTWKRVVSYFTVALLNLITKCVAIAFTIAPYLGPPDFRRWLFL